MPTGKPNLLQDIVAYECYYFCSMKDLQFKTHLRRKENVRAK